MNLFQSLLDAFQQVAFIIFMNQVGNDLSVRFGCEIVSLAEQELFQFQIVFYDTVMYDGKIV